MSDMAEMAEMDVNGGRRDPVMPSDGRLPVAAQRLATLLRAMTLTGSRDQVLGLCLQAFGANPAFEVVRLYVADAVSLWGEGQPPAALNAQVSDWAAVKVAPQFAALVAGREQVVIVPDVAAATQAGDWTPLAEQPLAGAWMAAAMHMDGRLVAVLTVANRQVGALNVDDAAGFGLAALWLGMHFEHLRRLELERGNRARSDLLRAMLEQFERTLDLDELAEVTLGYVRRLVGCDASALAVYRLNSTTLEMVVVRLANGLVIQASPAACAALEASGFLRRLAQDPNPTVVADAQDEPGWVWPVQTSEMRSWLVSPLVLRGQVIGVLMSGKQAPNEYGTAALAALTAMAQPVGYALSNAQLFQAEQRSRRQAVALGQAARYVSSSLDLPRVLDGLLTQLQRLVPYDSASVTLLEAGHLRIVAAKGYELPTPDYLRDMLMHSSTVGFKDVLTTQQPYIIPDTLQEPGWVVTAVGKRIRSWMGVPLVVHDRVIGLFSVDRFTPGVFSPGDIEAAVSLAASGAVAIENARLFAQVHQQARTDELTGLPNRLALNETLLFWREQVGERQSTMGLMMVDLDGYKQVNDAYDHLVGDAALVQIAQGMRQVVPPGGFFARYGGDEFAAVLRDCKLDDCDRLADALRNAVETCELELPGPVVPAISATIGLAYYPLHQGAAVDLLRVADRALLYAKRNRNYGRRQNDRMATMGLTFGRMVYALKG